MDARAFTALVARLYETAGQPDQWHDMAAEAARVFDSPSCLLQFQNRRTGFSRVLGYTPNFTLRKIEDYGRYYFARDTWATRAMRKGIGEAVLGTELVPEQEIYGSELYSDWLQPMGIFDLCGGSSGMRNGDIGLVGIHRAYDAARFDGDDQHWMSLLLMHYGRALDLQSRLEKVQRERDMALDALNALDVGVIVTNAQAKIIFANTTAENFLRSAIGIEGRRNKLELTDPALNDRLLKLIHGASRTAAGRGLDPGGLLPISQGADGMLSLLVSPLANRFAHLNTAEPLAMIFVNTGEHKKRLPETVLKTLFGLTMAEAQLVCALMTGETLLEYTERRGLRENTTRSQLKAIFEKTGVGRQTDLLRALAANPILSMLRK